MTDCYLKHPLYFCVESVVGLCKTWEVNDSLPEGPQQIVQLVGVYNADGTLRGELAYFIGARLGRRHCSLCDITHGKVFERRDWRECRATLDVDLVTVHRDEAAPQVVEALNGRFPGVVAVTERGAVVLLGPEELEECSGSPEALIAAISAAAEASQLLL
jgi:hypothetical protein